MKISHAVVRDSIIDSGAQVSNCVIENALIGENARVVGQAKSLFVGDNSTVDLG